MGVRLTRLGFALGALGGCSWIYNPSEIPRHDAGPDAEIILDADPSMLRLTDVSPATIDEGTGDGGSRPAIVVVRGMHITPEATVEVTGEAGTKFEVVSKTISRNGNYIALAIKALVDDTLPDDQNRALTVKVTQPVEGAAPVTAMLEGALTINGLPELTAANVPTAAAMLKPRYSMVDVTGAPRSFTGVQMDRVIIRSASSIKFVDIVAVGNGGGQGASFGTGGPGGCNGGAGGSSGSCLPGGGGGAATGGGGGAGFAGDGTRGEGTNAGAAGGSSGNELITTYEGFMGISQNRAAGGGGGGATLLADRGAGGGGGGSVELTADGDVMIGKVDVTGGRGGGGAGVTASGGGGGGAGGLIMVRAGGALTSGMLLAPGGAGGPGGGLGGPAGGKGADGRIRWDAPEGSAPSATPAARRGPAFATGTPTTVDVPDPELSVVGAANDGFKVTVRDHGGALHENDNVVVIGATGSVQFKPLLHQGHNLVCIVLEGGDRGKPEAEKCVSIAMLP